MRNLNGNIQMHMKFNYDSYHVTLILMQDRYVKGFQTFKYISHFIKSLDSYHLP